MVLQLLGATALALSVNIVFPVDFDVAEKAAIMKIGIWLTLFTLYVSVLKPTNSGRSSLGGVGYPYREDFSAPVSTNMLVLLPLGFYAFVFIAAFAIPMGIMQWFFGLGTLELRDCLQVVVLFVCLTCVSWGAGNLWEHALGWIVLWTLLYYRIIIPEVSELFANNGSLMRDMLPLIVTVFALPILVAGVGRQRHGESLLTRLLGAGLSVNLSKARDFLPMLKRPCPMGSASRALYWKEQQVRGMALAIAYAALIGVFIVVVLNILVQSREVEPEEVLTISATMMFSLLVPFSMTLFGVSYKNGKGFVSTFDRAMPVDTTAYLLVKCTVAFVALFVAFLTVQLIVVVFCYLTIHDFNLVSSEAWQRLGVFFQQPLFDWILQLVKSLLLIATAFLISSCYLTLLGLERKLATRATFGVVAYVFLLVVYTALTQDGVVAFNESMQRVMPRHLWLFILFLPVFLLAGFRALLQDRVLTSRQALILFAGGCAVALLKPFSMLAPSEPIFSTAAIIAGHMTEFLPLVASVAALWTLNSLRHG